MHITIDDREKSPEIVEEFSRLDVAVSIERLNHGDYFIDDHFIFERKTLSDLAASIIDGRLFRQVNFLSLLNNREEKIRCALLIEGSTSSLSSSNVDRRAINVDRRAIQGAILQISLFKGIPILRAMNPRESARIMAYAGNQNERMKIPKHVTISTGKFVHNKRRAQLMLLQSLPGVGPERANELLKTFGSVNKILQATEKELAETKYIGKTTAQKIKWVVCEAAPAYQV